MVKKMNRIVLIGNGFDKAHGLPTGYCDFMSYLVDRVACYEKIDNSRLKKVIKGREYRDSGGFISMIDKIGNNDDWLGVREIKNTAKFKLAINPNKKSIYFNSLIRDNDRLGYWSDLEAHYFKLLYEDKKSPENIALINSEFDHLKELIGEYLKTEIEDKTGIEGGYEIPTSHSVYDLLKHEPK